MQYCVCAFTSDVNEVSLSSTGELVVYHACEAILYTRQTNESRKYNAALRNERNLFLFFLHLVIDRSTGFLDIGLLF